ncbi:MAG: hypothetical protein U0R49_07175 [Fimbriimonadales bacterium]
MKKLRRSRGFTLVDTLIGFMVLAIGGLSLASVLPTLSRSGEMADENSKAAQLASRMIEQLRLARFENLNPTALHDLGLIQTYDGEGPMEFTNVSADTSTRFSPATALKSGRGEIEITSPTSNLKIVEVRVLWRSASGADRSITFQTAVGRY